MEKGMKISLGQIQEHYKKVRFLGSGEYGDVYLYRKEGQQQQYALKIIIAKSQSHRQEVLLQIQNTIRLQHKNVVKIFKYYEETYVSDRKKHKYEIGMLLEAGYCSLQDCFKNKQYRYTFQDIKKFIIQCIQLGAFLQQNNFVHRDIKPANIIIFGDKLEFKIADFGLSCEANRRPNGFAGTLNFCSPYLNNFYYKGNHRQPPKSNPFKDDVYSLAITCLQLIKYRYAIQDCPLEIRNLLEQMKRYDEKERPTFCDLLTHKAFAEQQKWSQKQQKNTENETKTKMLNKNSDSLLVIYENQKFTKKKIMQNNENSFQHLGHHTEKQSKHVINSRNVSSLKFKIYTFCKFHDNYLLCGSYDGELAIFDLLSNKMTKLNLRNNSYIAKVKTDKDNNVWIGCGDGKVIFIKKDELIQSIIYRKETQCIKVANLFGQAKNLTMESINIPQESIITIFQIPDKKFISEIACIDENNFAVGFSDGTIYVKWQNQAIKRYQAHFDSITSLKIVNKKLYSCDFQGFIKVYSLDKKIMQKQMYSCDNQLINFEITEVDSWTNVDIINLKGQLKTINKRRSEYNTFEEQLRIKNIIDVIFVEKRNYYVLTSHGDVYYKNNLIFEMERGEAGPSGGQWSNIQSTDRNELILTSYAGSICILTTQN